MKKLELFFIYFVSFIYLEVVFRLLVIDEFFKVSLLNMLLYLVPICLLLSLLTRISKKEKINRKVFIVIMSLIALWFSAQYVCKSYFDFYISWSVFSVADQINDFLGKAVLETVKKIPGIILLSLPLILSIINRKRIIFSAPNRKQVFLSLLFILFSYGGFICSILVKKDYSYSVYQLYFKVYDISLNVESMGVINSFLVDTRKIITGFEEEIVVTSEKEVKPREETNKEIKYSYNNLNIDFDNLINSETNNTIKQMHEYFKNESGSKQNEYTGMFKDKNLILFMAESFNEIAVNKNLTPTLYKLVNSGFVFENFYTPTIYSTIGGEFQELTSLYAQSTSILGKFRDGNIYFPFGVSSMYKNEGYNTFAYHNNSYQFQDRNKYLKSLGFDNFVGCYNGMEKLINCKIWPQSDVEMINATFDDYISSDKFMVFYATVSGHAGYDWSSNDMAKKHKEEALSANLGYSEGPYSYLAAQMELDRALELLIKKLDESGKLEDTVIALVGDHYPYELSINEVNEISSYEKDEVVEVNHSNFILWNSEMDSVKVKKVGSQLDVIPTIYNLFNLPYDSRLLIGKDILSTTDGLAIFGNRSWVSDKGTYFSSTRNFIPKEGVEVSEDYVNTMNQIVNNKINMSKLIIDNNYYQYVIPKNQ